MDRINGADTVDIGGGRRGFVSQSAAGGVVGTEVTGKFLNDVQEEIAAVIEKSGITLSAANQQQLWEALQSIAAPGFANRAAWLPVISMTITAPPAGAALGDIYLIPAGATGVWAGNQQKLAEWTGSSWRIVVTKNGHGISLPDGRVFQKIGGTYIEKLALDVQSGKWTYAVASGAANVVTVDLTPVPTALVAGLSVALRVSTNNTGAVTLNVNGLGAKAILNRSGAALKSGDLIAGKIYAVTYDGAAFVLNGLTFSDLLEKPTLGSLLSMQIFNTPGTFTYTPTSGTKFVIIEGVGGGGGGGGIAAPGAGSCVAGGGGGGGAYGRKLVLSPSTTTIAVGSGGVANNAAAGGTGGTTSFGSVMTLPGGNGGGLDNGGTTATVRGTASTSSAPTGIDIGGVGAVSGFGFSLSASSAVSGVGGSSPYGSPGPSSGTNGTSVFDGRTGSGYGTGGAGAVGVNNGSTKPGGAGTGGLLIVWEYAGG